MNVFFIDYPLHALIGVNKIFQWEYKPHKSFDTLKEKINTTPVLALPDLRQPFEIKTDVSGDAVGAVLMQHKKPIYYHYETLSKTIINYPTYEKELYALVQSVKKWKTYLMDKETIIHIDHQELQYLQSQTKLEQSRNFKWMGFL